MCTDVILQYSDPFVSGRTMDFAGTLNARICKIPVGHSFSSKAPNSAVGKTWIGIFGFIGVNYREVDMYSDGMNSEGLSVGLLWLDGTQYVVPKSEDAPKCVAITDMVAYLLSTCAVVGQVRKALDDIIVWGCVEPVLGDQPPALHIVAHDRHGKTLIVEFIDGKTVCYEYRSIYGQDIWKPGANPEEVLSMAPTGVLTNDPPYPEQLENYYKFIKENPGVIPGGNQPASERFTRAGILRGLIPESLPDIHLRASSPATQIQQRVQFVVQLLNRMEITEMEFLGNTVDFYTIWLVVKDHTNLIFYWYDNMNHDLRFVDLEKLDFENDNVDEVYLSAGEWFTPLTVTLTR
jgi:penicillin V acylase-like amidase (Ntn superfamily)